MANTVRIKRRAAGGAPGAPVSLFNAELAFNEQDNTLYYGYGTGGAGGTATSVIPIGGSGSFVGVVGNQSIGGTKTFNELISGSISGNSATSTALQTARTIALTGDVTYTSGSFDGTGNVTGVATLATVATPGTYRSVTVNAKGLVTVGTNPTTLAGFGITDAQPLDTDLTAIAALAGTTGFLKKTAVDTWTLDTSTYLTGITSGNVTTALGYTPENAANKGAVNGYASLDGTGKVPSAQLPGFVDDVREYATLPAFPATGETGVLYVAIDTSKAYRWGGSIYVEIAGSPGSTDAVTEGSVNLYFTTARARSSISVSGSLGYNSTTGVISFTDAVTSVAGRTGIITLSNTDISGLGTMSTQSASNVAITGGTIDGVTLDGGTF